VKLQKNIFIRVPFLFSLMSTVGLLTAAAVAVGCGLCRAPFPARKFRNLLVFSGFFKKFFLQLRRKVFAEVKNDYFEGVKCECAALLKCGR